MPNCFQLTKQGDESPSKLVDIDEAICDHLKVPAHPNLYVNGWYDSIGFALAMGHDWDRIEEDYPEEHYPELSSIIRFLRENYSANAWAEIGRR